MNDSRFDGSTPFALPPYFYRWIIGIVLAFFAGAGGLEGLNQLAVDSVTIEPEEAAFVVLINNYRAENGLQPLQVDAKLQKAAEWKSQDMADKAYFSHTDSKGRNPFDMMCQEAQYCENTYKGENIAAGYTSAQAVFTAWRTSPGHNSSMLSSRFVAMGIARVDKAGSPYGMYWTNEFGGILTGALTTPTRTPQATPTLAPPTSTAVPTGTVIPTPRPCPADFNGNRIVDIDDLLLMIPAMNKVATPATAKFDLTADGLVNGRDAGRWNTMRGACAA